MSGATVRSGGQKVGYGLIGAGAFGQFCAQAYGSLEGLRCEAVADVNADAAARAASATGMRAASIDEMLADEAVQIVHIATPPSTHRSLVEQCLRAGKHVLCEKPLALTEADARSMLEAAKRHERVLSVNLIMRYDPICEWVKAICEAGLLGAPLHGFFENYAKDEPLGPSHWFWKRQISGGIFIEHGVHFFDLFEWWLGAGKVASAQQVTRPNAELVEQVNATVRYGEGVLVNFYHGFTQASRMDRQEFRLLFERGSVRLFEWAPTAMEIDLLADAETLEQLRAMLPGATVETQAVYEGEARRVMSRHKAYEVDGRHLVRADVGMNKEMLYQQVLRGLMADQIAAIGDRGHARRITEQNGYDSLMYAVEADAMARGQGG